MKKIIFHVVIFLCLFQTAKSQYIQDQATSAQNAKFWISGVASMRSAATYSPLGQGQMVFYNDSLVIGKRRWVFGLANNATATPNSGADFVLWNYDDAGNYIGTTLSVIRTNGFVNATKGLSAPLINSNNSAGAISIIGGASAVDSYRGAEIGLRGGTYTTTPGEMTFHTGVGGSGAPQPERMRINANGLVTMGYGLKLNNPASNNLSFNMVGLAGPTFTTRSVGSKIVLWDAPLSASVSGWDIGMDSSHMWFGVAAPLNTQGFRFYGGTTQIGRIDGFGATDWAGQGRFKGWYTANGTGMAAEIGISNGRAVLIGYDRTSGATKYLPVLLSGGTTNSNQTNLIINDIGVGIGTLNPQSKLAVNGTITATQVKVTQTGWADYVFHKNYQLPTLPEVEKYVATHQHLEGIPSAAEVEKEGIDLGEMNKKLLAKVEELTLYLIEQNKKIAALEDWKMQQEKEKK
ncbi:hypothetical protein [Chitinophaga sp.]|uniref:hypothetical protein n=1 Tax=Chitinophaga sp. TaxID=1869181 RepID=UPI002F94749B